MINMRPTWAFAAATAVAVPLLLSACSSDEAAAAAKEGCELVMSGNGIDEDQLDALRTRAQNVSEASAVLAGAAAENAEYAQLSADAAKAAADLAAQLDFAQEHGFDPQGWSEDVLAEYQRQFPATRDDPYARLTSLCAAVVSS